VLRPGRVPHGLEEARAPGAFALFVAGDAARALQARRTLRAEGLDVDPAKAWRAPGHDSPRIAAVP